MLHFTHDITESMRGLQTRKDVDVIDYSSNDDRNSTQAAQSAADVIVKSQAPFFCDRRFPVSGAEDDVIKELRIGLSVFGWLQRSLSAHHLFSMGTRP
jgi:hypothetical protein